MRWACYLVFEAWKPAGSNDCIEQLQMMVDVAKSWDCACVPPSPRAMLDHTREGDELGASWSKYVRFDRMVDEAIGPTLDYDLNKGDLAACLAKSSVVRFSADPQLNFWKAGQGLYHKVLKEHGTSVFPSEAIERAVDETLRALGRFAALKVRRGDYLQRYGKVCQPLTADLVADLVVRETNETLLVLTEGDFDLTASLTERGFASDALTEKQLPKTTDSIFDYLVALRVAQHASKYLVVHPKFGLRDGGVRRSVDNIRQGDSSFRWIWCPRKDNVPIGFVVDDPASFYRRVTATTDSDVFLDGTFPFVSHIGG